jgi:predicted nucleotidyltransferase
MTLQELRATKRDEILALASSRSAKNVRVFGSVARGEVDGKSDVDFLVDLDPGRSLLDLCGLQRDLEGLLQSKVDVVSAKGLRDRVKETVFQDAVLL